jgi:hypothetical protein
LGAPPNLGGMMNRGYYYTGKEKNCMTNKAKTGIELGLSLKRAVVLETK